MFLRYRASLVDIDLNEFHVGIGFAELSDDWSDGLARAAPGSEEIDDDGAGGDEGFEDDGAEWKDLSNVFIGMGSEGEAHLSTWVTFPWDMVAAESEELRPRMK
jgi:hypothetical protein